MRTYGVSRFTTSSIVNTKTILYNGTVPEANLEYIPGTVEVLILQGHSVRTFSVRGL